VIRRLVLVAALAVVAMVIFASSAFVVAEGESALVTRLGNATRPPIRNAGLYFKVPLIEQVILFDARVLAWDGDPERIPVKDSKFIFVDTFARWRITDPLRFYNAVRDERGGQSRLDDILDGSVRDVVSTHSLLELVRSTNRPLTEAAEKTSVSNGEAIAQALLGESGDSTLVRADPRVGGKRVEVRQAIFDICQRKLKELDLGMELVDLRIKRIDYTEQVEQEVFRRMISEQQQLAERYRAQGIGRKAEIAGITTQEQQRIESESYRKAQEILGEAEAESTRIYASAYNQDADFYRFLKSLETYRRTIDGDDTLILSTDSDLLRLLKSGGRSGER
jgi:membrane protease subunit HflC